MSPRKYLQSGIRDLGAPPRAWIRHGRVNANGVACGLAAAVRRLLVPVLIRRTRFRSVDFRGVSLGLILTAPIAPYSPALRAIEVMLARLRVGSALEIQGIPALMGKLSEVSWIGFPLSEATPTLVFRDFTQIDTPHHMTFFADTAAANRWMRQRYGNCSVVFSLPKDNAAALAFREAIQADGFSIIALRRPTGMA